MAGRFSLLALTLSPPSADVWSTPKIGDSARDFGVSTDAQGDTLDLRNVRYSNWILDVDLGIKAYQPLV